MAKVSLRTYNREIESMLDGGLFSEAVAHCLHILKTHPKHLETYRLLGKAYLELKQYSDATDIFNRVLACVPNDFVANVGMGIIRDEENRLDDAIWHMERAFETQPSNPAIQNELQRLYARRDGSAPPRIRMTRGALAQMYLQGELYPQAISEIKGLLNEDPGRTDMQALLARAHFRSGQKTEAAEVASSLLHRYPYCLDANRILAEILSADRPDSAGAYLQRVFDLDPYAAHAPSIFQPAEAPDSAVALEKLDWNGQPVVMPPDWREAQGISLQRESVREEQPDWLKGGFSDRETVPPTPLIPSVPGISASPKAESDIPDFLRKHGWEEATGAFDESKPVFGEEEPPAIAAGELPDWVREMAPAQSLKPAEENEQLPDWMNRIDPSILGATAAATSAVESEQPEWLKGMEQPASGIEAAQPAGDMPDWLSDLGTAETPAQPAFLPEEQPDWLKPVGGEAESKEPESFAFALESEPTPTPAHQPAFIPEEEPDWLKPMGGELESKPTPAPPAMTETPVATEKDLDDSFAWLESLAARQGATEGLLMKPEERLEQEPDWVKQAKSLSGKVEPPAVPSAEAVSPIVEPQAESAGDLESLGRTGQEQDDSFAWLENLAARQGATEGLLTRPEDRLEQEPDWVKQAKEIGGEEVAPAPDVLPEPSADTAVWLRSLDQEEPVSLPSVESDTSIWLKGLEEEKAKEEPAGEPIAADTDMWLKGLGDEEIKPEPASGSADETAMWLKSLDEAEAEPAVSPESVGLPDWMQSLESEAVEPEAEAALPSEAGTEEPAWPGAVEEPLPRVDTGGLPGWLRGLDQEEAESAAQEELPAWLRDETGEVVAEPVKIEPTRAEEWQPAEEAPFVPPVEEKPRPAPKPRPERAEGKKPAPKKAEAQPGLYREPVTRKAGGMMTPEEDPILGSARNELSRSNIPGALDTYSKLIKRGRFLDEVIFDLREALYRYPVEVSIWQSLGDAYMRANRLQDALDAYTKAEELLR